MDWYPEKMFSRYEHWIDGLEWDWCISRQRDSGIPFPVWYCEGCNGEVIADREQLPVDPIQDEPPVESCPDCGHDEFRAEEDVFDTWATSSLTPLINAGWNWDEAAGEFTMDHPELYPANMRPQGHDIISFWLFHTIVKCVEHTGEVPFESVLINGHVLDEDRKKMSSSKGNVVLPGEVIDEYPVDAIRYWSASSAVGDDFPFKTNELTMGEKLIRKIWNASKLGDQLAPGTAPEEPDELEPIDRWLLATLDDEIEALTDLLDEYEFAKARDRLRSFFWNTFCDNYLEIAKQRADDGLDPSAAYALTTTHRTVLKLFAPLLPHVTEEVWGAAYAGDADADSIHTTDWPEPRGYDADLAAGETAMEVVSALRKYKSDNKLPLNADLEDVEVYGDLEGFEEAIREVMHVRELSVLPAAEAPELSVRIADVNLDYSTLGPKYGGTVGAFDDAIEAGEFELDGDELRIASERLAPGEFEIRRERSYDGEGKMIETDSAVVIVK